MRCDDPIIATFVSHILDRWPVIEPTAGWVLRGADGRSDFIRKRLESRLRLADESLWGAVEAICAGRVGIATSAGFCGRFAADCTMHEFRLDLRL